MYKGIRDFFIPTSFAELEICMTINNFLKNLTGKILYLHLHYLYFSTKLELQN